MTIQIKHAFVSLKGDGTDATQVQPSYWNAAHSFTMQTSNLIGRLTAGVGSAEEIPISAYVASILNAADAAEFLAALGIGAFTTGDTKFSVNPTPAAGWIAYQGTPVMGKTGSGGTYAGPQYQALYELIYNNINDTFAPVSGGRSGNPTTDFNAGKTITLPWFSGRAIIGAGGGGTLTTRILGNYAGFETHTLTQAQHASYALVFTQPTFSTDAQKSSATVNTLYGGGASGPSNFVIGMGASTVSRTTDVAANSGGSNQPHPIMQPYIPLWVHVKL